MVDPALLVHLVNQLLELAWLHPEVEFVCTVSDGVLLAIAGQAAKPVVYLQITSGQFLADGDGIWAASEGSGELVLGGAQGGFRLGACGNVAETEQHAGLTVDAQAGG